MVNFDINDTVRGLDSNSSLGDLIEGAIKVAAVIGNANQDYRNRKLNQKKDIAQMHYGLGDYAGKTSADRNTQLMYGFGSFHDRNNTSAERIASMQFGIGGAYDRHGAMQFGPNSIEAQKFNAGAPVRDIINKKAVMDFNTYKSFVGAENKRKVAQLALDTKVYEDPSALSRVLDRLGPGTSSSSSTITGTAEIARPKIKYEPWYTDFMKRGGQPGQVPRDSYTLPTTFMGGKLNFIPFRYLAGTMETPRRAFDWANENISLFAND